MLQPQTVTMTCVLCSSEYQARAQGSYTGLCPNHWSKDTLREWDRLEAARRHCPDDVPSTLTLLEWLGIITEWRGVCALCELQSFGMLSMWDASKGLVAGNVVPLCRACHYHKQHGFSGACERVQAALIAEKYVTND